MAKSKSSSGSVSNVAIEFPRTGNPWTDAGTVGLYRILNRGKSSYVDPPADLDFDLVQASRFPDVRFDELQQDRFVIRGPTDQVQACLEAAYERLVSIYFNVSSKKQKEEKGTYNFYYCRSEQDFISFAKKKAAGAALLLFDKAARPSREQAEWGTLPDAAASPSGQPVGCHQIMPTSRRSLMSF